MFYQYIGARCVVFIWYNFVSTTKTKHGFRTYFSTWKMALYEALTFWITFDFLNFYFVYEYVRKVDTTKEESILSCTDPWSGSPTVIGKLRCMRPIFRFPEVTIERPCWRPTYMYVHYFEDSALDVVGVSIVLSPRVSTQKIPFAKRNILPFLLSEISN